MTELDHLSLSSGLTWTASADKQSNGGNQIPVDASFVISQIDAYLIKQGFQL